MKKDELLRIIKETPRWAPEFIFEQIRGHHGSPYGDFTDGDTVAICPSQDTPGYWCLIWSVQESKGWKIDKDGKMYWDNIEPDEFTRDMAKYFRFSRYVPWSYDEDNNIIILDSNKEVI